MPAPNPSPSRAPSVPPFVGRKEEGRAVLLSVRAARSVAVVAPPSYGKSALLSELSPALAELTAVLSVPKVAPFGQFLIDLHAAMHAAGIFSQGVAVTRDLETDAKNWKKVYAGNEPRARSLVEALRLYTAKGVQPPALVVDDAGGVTSAAVPWLTAISEHAALVLAVYPDTLTKNGTRRLWQKCDRVDLGALSAAHTRALVDGLTQHYGVTVADPGAYSHSIAQLSGGVPGEVVRLVRYVSTDDVLRRRGLGSGFTQSAAARQERGVSLAPLLLVLGALLMVVKYVGRARGEADTYIIGAIGMAVFLILGPWIRRAVSAK